MYYRRFFTAEGSSTVTAPSTLVAPRQLNRYHRPMYGPMYELKLSESRRLYSFPPPATKLSPAKPTLATLSPARSLEELPTYRIESRLPEWML